MHLGRCARDSETPKPIAIKFHPASENSKRLAQWRHTFEYIYSSENIDNLKN